MFFTIFGCLFVEKFKRKFLNDFMKPHTNSETHFRKFILAFCIAACAVSKSCSKSRLWSWKLFWKPTKQHSICTWSTKLKIGAIKIITLVSFKGTVASDGFFDHFFSRTFLEYCIKKDSKNFSFWSKISGDRSTFQAFLLWSVFPIYVECTF